MTAEEQLNTSEETPRLVMRYAALSDVGMVRAKNDDSGYAGEHLAVVADGMGGHAGGNVASASTVLDLIHLDHDNYSDASTVLADEIQTANSILNQLVHVDPKLAGMGTTVTALLLSDNRLHYAHIGDSRAYRLRDGAFEQVSVDHTFVQRLVDEGRLRADEAESHPHKNVLMRVLGDVDASPELDLDVLEAREGDRWLLCSDGLNYVPHHMVEQVVRSTANLERCARQLIELTLAAGSPDNVTVVLVDLVAEDSAGPLPESSFPGMPGLTDSPAHDAGGAPHGADDTEVSVEDVTEPESGNSTEDLRTDPNLGAHLVAEVLRMELATRPHHLVGSAALALESGNVPNIAGHVVARRAASVLTHRSPVSDLDDVPELASPRPRSRWWRWVSLFLVMSILVIAGWWGYAWTQTRYYVGELNGRVAIFNGVSQQLGPISFSRLHSVTDIQVSGLPQFSQQRVHDTMPAGDLADAERIVQDLTLGIGLQPDPCATTTPTRGGTSPSDVPKVTPTKPGSTSPAGTPTLTPTKSPTGTPTPTTTNLC